jgi:uncharacterized protein (TIGR03086 family)
VSDSVALLGRIAAAVADVIDSGVDPLAETPCPDWNVAQLIGHLVGGDRLNARILTGQKTVESLTRLAPAPDQAAPSAADYRAANARLIEVLTDPQILSSRHVVPVGRMTGRQVLTLRSVEHLLHGWDLAASAGEPTADLEQPASALAAPARDMRAAVGDAVLAHRSPFAPPVAVADHASDLHRLVALFGRDPAWRPDPEIGYARITNRFEDREDVELPDGSRRGFGARGMRVHGQVFATLHDGRLMVKLPEPQVKELIGTGVGLPLGKPGQQPMREWVLVPIDGAATRRAEQAYRYVGGAA